MPANQLLTGRKLDFWLSNSPYKWRDETNGAIICYKAAKKSNFTAVGSNWRSVFRYFQRIKKSSENHESRPASSRNKSLKLLKIKVSLHLFKIRRKAVRFLRIHCSFSWGYWWWIYSFILLLAPCSFAVFITLFQFFNVTCRKW